MSNQSTPRVPSFRLHKPSGRAVVTLDGRDYYLGDHGSGESRDRYARLISEWTANGYRMIRFADVLLLKAECEARTMSDDLGLGEVNRVRSRAANPDGFVMEPDGITPAANHVIGLYPSFSDALTAMKAIQFERKLELGQEGHRYYDLQRWELVVSELNRILEYEKSMPWGPLIYGNAVVGPEDVNYPIPQRQIDAHHGKLYQNR